MTKQQELIVWASSKIGIPFIWGHSDCTTITLEGIKLYYGSIFNFENTWVNLKEALRAYKKYGVPNELLENAGFYKVSKNYEQTGDIFVWSGESYYLIAMVINQNVLVADENKLLVLRPINTFDKYICYRKNIEC